MATLLDEALKEGYNTDVAKMPKYLPLSTAKNIETVSAIRQNSNIPNYKTGTAERFLRGANQAIMQMDEILPSLQLYGETAQMSIGGYFGASEEFIDRKKLNILTAQRNIVAKQQERLQNVDAETADSWAFGIGQGAANFGLMLLGGGFAGAGAKALGATATKQIAAKTVAGLTANVLLENVEQQSERINIDENGEIDVNQITPEWARKSTVGATAYLGISTILEKGFGFGKQVKMWETPIKTSNKAIKVSSPVLKMAAKNAISEGMTEGLQSLTSTGILLAEGKINIEQLPDRLKDAWKEAVIGGLIGGSVGTAVGINQAHNVKTMLDEQIGKVVTDPETREQIVDAIYESGTAEMTNVISKELELSSELNTKHGAIYDTMQGAIYDAINNAGAFQGVEEAEIAQYVSDTSKMFANQVLAEANKRGVLIDDVLKASDIKFENGKIYMQAGKEVIAESSVTEENSEALKGSIEMNVNEQGEEINLDENEAVKRGLSKETAQKQVDKLQKGKEYRINNAARVTFTGNYNEEGMPIFINAKGNEQAYSLTNVFDEIAPVKMDENGRTKLFQSAMLAGINSKQKVNVVDLSSQFTTDSSLSKTELSTYIQGLINKTQLKSSDKKAILQFVARSKRVGKNDVLIPDHIAGSSKVEANYKGERNTAVNNIVDLIENSVLIEKTKNKTPNVKPNVDYYLRFYVPVKINNNIFAIRIVAENNTNNNLFNIEVGNVYDLIIDKKLQTPSTSPAKQGSLSKSATNNIITNNSNNFNPEQITIEDMLRGVEDADGNIYYQLKNAPKQPKIFKGAYDVSAKAIELFKDADYSTLPHELAHYWLDNMWGYYRSGKASEAYSNNFQGVLDWLGVKDGQINLTRAQQEKFARGYEKYLLNGYAPNGLIQGAFDDYDKWLQKVYNDARELKVKLTPDAIEFFDSMTTGELLEYDVPETQAQIREKNIEQMNKDIQEARKFVVEKQTQYNNYDGGNAITKDTVPVTTEGEKKQSRAYTNQASILGIAEELNYNKADIAEQNKLATDYVRNNLDEARQVVNGEKEAPSDILKNAIYNAYLKEMLAIGDNEAYVNALKNQSLELTRAGQEIASQRGAIENIFDSAYWIRRIENLKKMKLAGQKFGGFTGQETEQALSKMNDFIKNKVEAIMPEFMKAEPEQQKKIAEKLSKEIAAEFKVKPDTKLYQTMYEPSEVRTRTNAYNYIYRYINGALGLDLTREQYNEIIAKTMAIQKSIETTRNRNGNPSALFFKNISEMEAYANSIEPSPALAILTSTVGRGNMLFSPKTIALNIESNIVNFFTEAITRRIQNGTVSMVVDNQVIKDYLAYSREVFNTSGYQVSSMPSLDPTTQILSEKMTTTAGDRVVDKLGRFFEQTIFKYGLGAPDLFFKDMTFVDTANILATKEAKGDVKKATELFKDICLIEPKTAKGKELREIAINEALIATYQNKGKTSDLALGIRNAINKASGSANIGDMLSPFVKTPANVIGLGFDYSMGGLVALKNIRTIYNDIQNGTFTDTTRKSLRSLARNGIGFVVAALIANMIDDDDYIPEYALLDQKQRELVKMKGGVFNSVKIGDKYISLDYFGPLAMPLVSFLNAKRGYDAKNKAWNYFQGSAYQALKLPVIGDIKSLLEGTGRTLTKDVDENIKMAEDAAIDFISSRSIPAIVTDIAKMTDEYERETNNNAINRLKSKIPVIREELPAQYNYGTGKPRETQNPISQLLAGARIKDEITSPVIREIDKLLDKGESITLQKVTKSGKLAGLSDNDKVKAEREFAKIFATNVNLLIHTPEYKILSDEEKAVNINNIRSLAVGQIKAEYGLDNKEKSPKRKKLTKKLQ
jgi:hypothetical protein